MLDKYRGPEIISSNRLIKERDIGGGCSDMRVALSGITGFIGSHVRHGNYRAVTAG
jgi:hypothetical protein